MSNPEAPRRYHATPQRDLIVNNLEYDAQPLPGPFKIKQLALKLDKD
ncbi:hypothetical protein [Micavibrio aeruginosavorus]|uniref:Uncharacterized protein n=1 Tax=Micavibrio aeruginosavorus (strain ARL-13) TaxID=856793 RepID=G2KLC8_MICAA|nr:hypothetical protein [Micavibrio aeruginosavorus]AEP08364.1 hypothetical protein MICA_16 [Micavibrio aeruginosavorus ARL-13]